MRKKGEEFVFAGFLFYIYGTPRENIFTWIRVVGSDCGIPDVRSSNLENRGWFSGAGSQELGNISLEYFFSLACGTRLSLINLVGANCCCKIDGGAQRRILLCQVVAELPDDNAVGTLVSFCWQSRESRSGIYDVDPDRPGDPYTAWELRVLQLPANLPKVSRSVSHNTLLYKSSTKEGKSINSLSMCQMKLRCKRVETGGIVKA